MYLYCCMFSASCNHSKYCTNIIIYLVVSYIHPAKVISSYLLPNAAMNQWIQGIMLFDFVMKQVPGRTHLAADALSRRPLGEGEEVEEHNDDWLDDIALYTYC